MLVMANKQDLPRAMSVSDVTEALAEAFPSLSGLSNTVGAAAHHWLSKIYYIILLMTITYSYIKYIFAQRV